LTRRFLLFSAFLISITCRRSPAAQVSSNENQFGVSITLFSTMAAINAAGYDAGLQSDANYPIRNQIRAELAKKTIPSLNDLKEFYKDHRRGTDTATLSAYISFALLAGGPPDFKLETGELPPDVQPLIAFSRLLADFYKEADLQNLWARSQQAFAVAMRTYQEPVLNALLEANAYLRNPTNGQRGRRFQIFLSLLAAPNVVEVRNYKGDTYVVLTPSRQPLADEVRSAYLSYLLDPLSLRFSKTLDTKKELKKYAEKAPALEEAYKDDFSLLVTKSLIKAIDSRMMHGQENRDAYIASAMREGYILTAAFAELLPLYEKQPEAMRLYYPDLVNGIDVGKEKKRLKDVEFAQTVSHPVVTPSPQVQQVSEAQRSLDQAQSLLAQHDLDNSKKLFRKLLEQTDSKQMHAQAYFGLAQAAVQERQADQAAIFFQKAVDLNSDPGIVAWSHVYLGRLAMLHDDSQAAMDHFKRALSLEGAPGKAKEAAQDDLKKLSGDKEE
jgi:tetratricopeptide (TPR) repeat protein